MSTIALFSWIILTERVISQTENVCIWGRDEYINRDINGAFVFQGYFNGAPSYKKQYGDDIKYMFFDLGRYIISRYEPGSTSVAWNAQCSISTSYPYECGLNQWNIAEVSSPIIDPEVYCKMGSCPEWICDAIVTDIEYMGCDDVFPVKVGANAWSNINGDLFFYFNYLNFRWTCDESYFNTITNSLAYAERGWINTTKGSTVSLHFVAPFDQSQQIQCVQYMTDEPSAFPSIVPSSIPTINPTFLPSTEPSVKPSHHPSTYPTAKPSYHTSTYPTAKASADPTSNPSQHPSIGPFVKSSTTLLTTFEMDHNTFSGTENDTSGKQELVIDTLAAVLIAISGTLCLIIIIVLIVGATFKTKKEKQEIKIARAMSPRQKKQSDPKHGFDENEKKEEKMSDDVTHKRNTENKSHSLNLCAEKVTKTAEDVTVAAMIGDKIFEGIIATKKSGSVVEQKEGHKNDIEVQHVVEDSASNDSLYDNQATTIITKCDQFHEK